MCKGRQYVDKHTWGDQWVLCDFSVTLGRLIHTRSHRRKKSQKCRMSWQSRRVASSIGIFWEFPLQETITPLAHIFLNIFASPFFSTKFMPLPTLPYRSSWGNPMDLHHYHWDSKVWGSRQTQHNPARLALLWLLISNLVNSLSSMHKRACIHHGGCSCTPKALWRLVYCQCAHQWSGNPHSKVMEDQSKNVYPTRGLHNYSSIFFFTLIYYRSQTHGRT